MTHEEGDERNGNGDKDSKLYFKGQVGGNIGENGE